MERTKSLRVPLVHLYEREYRVNSNPFSSVMGTTTYRYSESFYTVSSRTATLGEHTFETEIRCPICSELVSLRCTQSSVLLIDRDIDWARFRKGDKSKAWVTYVSRILFLFSPVVIIILVSAFVFLVGHFLADWRFPIGIYQMFPAMLFLFVALAAAYGLLRVLFARRLLIEVGSLTLWGTYNFQSRSMQEDRLVNLVTKLVTLTHNHMHSLDGGNEMLRDDLLKFQVEQRRTWTVPRVF